MILCLTYHKIVAPGTKPGDEDFYSVSTDVLDWQLQSVLDAGFTPLNIGSPADSREKRFVITFDDGTSDHFDIAAPSLKRHGMKGIFFVPTAKLNRPGYLTDQQVEGLARDGHVIGCHSHEHKRLDRMTESDIRHQLKTSCERLEELAGQPIRAFAPPGGFINVPVRATALGLGMTFIRTMRWGFNPRLDFTDVETVPINRHTHRRQFGQFLQGKQPRLLYLGKQAAKALVPERAYQGLRSLAFKLGGKH